MTNEFVFPLLVCFFQHASSYLVHDFYFTLRKRYTTLVYVVDILNLGIRTLGKILLGITRILVVLVGLVLDISVCGMAFHFQSIIHAEIVSISSLVKAGSLEMPFKYE